MKKFYIINWDKLIHIFNEQNISQLTQTRIAKAYGCTTAAISLSKTRPMTMENIDLLYKETYDKYFKYVITFDKLLIEKTK